MNLYRVPVTINFLGTVDVYADSSEDAESIVLNNVSLGLGSVFTNEHDDIADWDFELHSWSTDLNGETETLEEGEDDVQE